MLIRQEKIRLLSLCLFLSIAVHCVALLTMRMFGSYRFGAAVGEAPVMVSLSDPGGLPAAQPATAEPKEAAHKVEKARKDVVAEKSAPLPDPPMERKTKVEEPLPLERPEMAEKVATEAKPAPVEPKAAPPVEAAAAAETPNVPTAPPEALAKVGGSAGSAGGTSQRRDYFFAKGEKLTYLVSMMGLPIGNAELEAKNDERGTTITLRVRSNAAISGVYPVDDVVETQHIDGRYLMTKIRQHEGSFKSDEYFSINLAQKRVSYADNLHYRNLKMTVPTEEVLDTLSGIYSLRTRQLQVGKTETLHIFDSEQYAEVPVEILRREEMRLPNLAKVDALVLRPLQKTAGIFRRTGDILIWMTDDANKVPVKIVTTIALGRVTAELVSAESESRDPAPKPKVN